MESIQTAVSIGTFLAVVAGGAWTLFKVQKSRHFAQRIAFEVAIDFVAKHRDHWIVSLDAFVNNMGQVRYEVTRFTFDLRCLYSDDPITDDDKAIGCQVVIPHLIRDGSWLPHGSSGSFIEPGLQTRYSYVAAVPIRASVALLHGLLDYRGTDFIHTPERLAQVPVNELHGSV